MNLLYANDRQGQYPPSWYHATANTLPEFPSAKGSLSCDVCIIGAGFTGVSTALHLAEAGYDVILLDAHRVGWGASGRNGGQVGSGQRKDQHWIEKRYGLNVAKAVWQIAEEAKATVKRLIKTHRIDCDWRDGIIHASHTKADAVDLEEELEHLNTNYGTRSSLLTESQAADALSTDAYFNASIDRTAGHLHPLNYVFGLAKAASAAGVRIFENTPAITHSGTHVQLDHAKIASRTLVIATNGYTGKLNTKIASRVMPINNFIVATAPLETPLIKHRMAVADTRFVVNYYRESADGRLLFGGGENYGYRFPMDIERFVRRAMLKVYPQLKDVAITHAWGGTLAITSTREPYFAQPEPDVFTAAGYSGHGVALATEAGVMLSQAIRGQTERFDLQATLLPPNLPGLSVLQHPIQVAAMSWFALRDRLGI
ncbi:MAG: FAD-binding oxidoreductase [Pseudomonadota bacterium]